MLTWVISLSLQVPYLLAEAEAMQRRRFPTSDFLFDFDTPDTSTPGGNLSGVVRRSLHGHQDLLVTLRC